MAAAVEGTEPGVDGGDAAPGAEPLPRGRRIVVSAHVHATTAAAYVAEALRRAAAPRISLALTGGRTARPVYERLAEIPDLPWSRVDIFFGDERRVPPDDERSNYRLAKEALLDRLVTPPERVYRMEGEVEDANAAARRYAALLPAAVDVLLLGVGADAHIASLFPHAPQLAAAARVLPSRAPEPPRDRLTVTPPVIRAARERVVIVTGEKKAEAVRQALEGPWDPVAVPAQLVRDGAWILDEGAASALRRARP